MRAVRLHGTDIVLSRLSFGTSGLHHLLSTARRQSILAAALDAGFTHFDTAPLYGWGLAENELGRFLKTRRARVTVTTKIGLYPPGIRPGVWSVLATKTLAHVFRGLARPRVNWSLATVVKEFETSLRRLQTDTVDLLLLHEPSYRSFQPDALLAWLTCEREKGRIRGWGLAGETARVCEWLVDDHGLAMVLQVRDSLEHHEADQVLAHGRVPHLTYGYFSSALRGSAEATAPDVIGSALVKNHSGSVLVSTHDPTHIVELATVAESESGRAH